MVTGLAVPDKNGLITLGDRMHKCARCKEDKTVEQMAKNVKARNGLDYYCKDCKSRQTREYRAANRELMREKDRKYRKEHRERIKLNGQRWVSDNPEYRKLVSLRSKLKNEYGMTVEQFESMVREQSGVCKICKQPPVEERLHVDHDHKTGRIRGLLCGECNRGIGLLKEDLDVLRSAFEYLEGISSIVR